ncbi:hypothetical protein EMIT0P171_30135 [Pseudomonas sp. IT-P171]
MNGIMRREACPSLQRDVQRPETELHSRTVLGYGVIGNDLAWMKASPSWMLLPKPEALRFGTGEQDHDRYLTVYSVIVTPFIDIARHTTVVSWRPLPWMSRFIAPTPLTSTTLPACSTPIEVSTANPQT